MIGSIVSFIIGLFLGSGIGFLMVGVFKLEGQANEFESYKDTIRRQAEFIEELEQKLKDEENDLK